MNIKKKLIAGLLGGAMLALPVAVPAFAQPSYGTNPSYIQPVDWWWDNYQNNRQEYMNHGWHQGYYNYGGKRYACARARDLEGQAWQDRRTGHPAAAKDVQREASAARAACYTR